MEDRKKHKVLDHVVGVVKGYKMCFNIDALKKVEPAFANTVVGTEEDEVHGVAIKLSEESMKRLDAQEFGYDKVKVTVRGYNGRVVEDCSMYMNTKSTMLPPDKQTPSQRYLDLVVKNAIDSDIDEGYINKLKATKAYTADEETLERRKALPAPSSLSPFTVEQLSATKQELDSGQDRQAPEFGYLSILGYVLKIPISKVFFKVHLGRDITAWVLRMFRGEAHGAVDDLGLPPFQDVLELKEDEKEFIRNWMDHYLDNSEVVGYLEEFLVQNDVTKM